MDKQIERLAYAWLRLSLVIGWAAVNLFVLLAPLRRKRKPTKDFLFFPYTHKDNIGSRSRFQEYFPLLDNDGYTYDAHFATTTETYMALYHSSKPTRTHEYLFYSRLFWQRLRLVMKAGSYRAVFFQRTLFPEYYDQRRALLEKLLYAYHDNVTVDFYDADYARNEPFYLNVIRYCHKVTVVNRPLYEYFSRHHPRVFFNTLSIDAAAYAAKRNYTLSRPVRVFWTGSISNAQLHLGSVMPVLEALNKQTPLVLVLVAINKAGLDRYDFIEQHIWDLRTFGDLITGADVAIYPAAGSDVYSRGKVAYKTLEYVATRVPMVASSLGLSEHFKDEEDVLLAHTPDEWNDRLGRLISDESLRKRLADSAYDKLMRHHDVNATYRNFLAFLNA